MTSAAYTAAYNEVKNLGGDTSTQRTEEQTFIGTFWAYDGTPSLCAPPKLYNQITVHIADQRGLSAIQFARLLALVNVAMADAGMTIWEPVGCARRNFCSEPLEHVKADHKILPFYCVEPPLSVS